MMGLNFVFCLCRQGEREVCLHEEEGQQVLLAKKRGSRLNKFKKPLRVKQIFCQ